MTDQINRDRGEKYVAFALPHDQDFAVMCFEERYGYKPQEVFNVFEKLLLVGPVEEDND